MSQVNAKAVVRAPAPLFDTHAHLDATDFEEDRADVLQRALDANVGRIVTVGSDLASSQRCLALHRSYPEHLSATAGIHPHEAGAFEEGDWPDLEALWKTRGVVAVGEIGLDYHYDLAPRPRQRELFERQIHAASKHPLPIVVHIRDAFDDAFDLLGHGRVGPAGGVLHCFTGGVEECRRGLDLGLEISIAGIATFRNAHTLRAAIRYIPDNRLLIETDAPYLAPVPHRGRRNEPAFVVHTATRVAEERSLSLGELCEITWSNSCRVFGDLGR